MLLGFKPRFKEPIQLGTKVFTMRKKRKIEPKIGETLFMYTGLRTPKCELISNKEKLISTQKAWVKIECRIGDVVYSDSLKICIDGRALSDIEISEFVKYDGFYHEYDFVDYWVNSSLKHLKAKERKGKQTVVGSLDLFHWTDLRY